MKVGQNHPLHILVIEDTKFRQTISLEKKVYSIGRHKNNIIMICDDKASRFHATLMRRYREDNQNYSYWIVDGDMQGNKSLNGIYVNGEKCLVKELKNGDLINFGCQVNATYHALNNWSDTVIDIQTLKSDIVEQNSVNSLSLNNNILTNSINKLPTSKQFYLRDLDPDLDININFDSYLHHKETFTSPENQDNFNHLIDKHLFQEYLSLAIEKRATNQSIMAILLLEIENFHGFNKTLGSNFGKELSEKVSQNLKSKIRKSDILSRWNDNKFALFLPQINQVKNIDIIYKRIQQNMNQPIEISGYTLKLDINFGLAIYPQDGQNSSSLLNKATISLLDDKYQNTKKESDKNQLLISNINPEYSRLVRSKKILQQALESREIKVFYKPQVKFETGLVTGIEAIVRWNHPRLGQIPNHQFISLANRTNFSILLGYWLLKTACLQNKVWQKMELPFVRMSVNLYPQQLEDPNLVFMIKQVLEETELSPHWLGLEVREKTILQNVEKNHKVLQELKQLGIHLSIDDVTGDQTSLSYFAQLSLTTLKITQDTKRISKILEFSRNFNLQVVAEGIETVEQLKKLHNLYSKEIREYLLNKPVTQDKATKFLLLNNSPLNNLTLNHSTIH